MWQRIVWGVVFPVCVGASDGSLGQNQPRPGNLIAHCSWGRLEVISGRVALTDNRLGRRSTITSGDPGTGVKEMLSFSARSPDAACLHYEYADGEQRMFVDVERSTHVTIERVPHPDSQLATIRFRQPERGKITLVIEVEKRSYRIVGDSFWHLVLADPQAFQDHFAPVLELLRPDWRMERKAGRIEAALFDVAHRRQLPDTRRMQQLVAQLRHSEFLNRQAADRQLRELGQSAFAYLDDLNERTLDVEQRTRIRRIKESLRINQRDTPARVAAWLAGDIGVWLVLLDREDEQKRIVAARHLASITGGNLAFDPLAGETERRSQIGQLRADFGVDGPVLVSRVDNTTRLR